MGEQVLLCWEGTEPQLTKRGERPLVTFALFAYNQEKYILEAIESVLAQTYQPLEIILSDDCSSDRTPEIMEEKARAYRGPHRVIVRKGTRNVGTLSHLLSAARISQGEIFIVAAGDDISLPERTSTIVEEFHGSRHQAYSGEDIAMGPDGQPLAQSPSVAARRSELHRLKPAWIHGATAAYRRHFLELLPLPEKPVLFEDIALTDIMQALGFTAMRSTARLIKYRNHPESVFNSVRGEDDPAAREEKLLIEWARIGAAKAYALETAQSLSADYPILPTRRATIEREWRFFDHMARWKSDGVWGRIARTYYASRIAEFRGSAIVMSLERIFGERVFRLYRKSRSRMKGAFSRTAS